MRIFLFFLLVTKIFPDCKPVENFIIKNSLVRPLVLSDYCKPVAGFWISTNSEILQTSEELVVEWRLHPIWVWERTSHWSSKKQKRFFNSFDSMMILKNGTHWEIKNKPWLPKTNRCSYLTKTQEIVNKWDISLTLQEKIVLEQQRVIWCEYSERFE
jgi:hypothetical protein